MGKNWENYNSTINEIYLKKESNNMEREKSRVKLGLWIGVGDSVNA